MEQKKLSMSFDWKAKMNHGSSPYMVQRPLMHNSEVKGSTELVQSILMHIENLVKKSDDIRTWDECAHNPVLFVKKKLIDSVILPYVSMHKIDSGSILYIAQSLKNEAAKMDNGLMIEGKVENGIIHISNQAIIQALVQYCM